MGKLRDEVEKDIRSEEEETVKKYIKERVIEQREIEIEIKQLQDRHKLMTNSIKALENEDCRYDAKSNKIIFDDKSLEWETNDHKPASNTDYNAYEFVNGTIRAVR